MLPRSCLRLADSKSNSSTRFPRTTTTRVSSGWVASMSILLAIEPTLRGALESTRPAPGRRTEDALRRTELWVETRDRLGAMRQTRIRRPAAAQSVLVGHPPHHPGPWIERLVDRATAAPVGAARFGCAGD